MVWSEGNVSLKNPVTPPGIDPGTVRLVAQRLNHYATPRPYLQRSTEDNLTETYPQYHFFKSDCTRTQRGGAGIAQYV